MAHHGQHLHYTGCGCGPSRRGVLAGLGAVGFAATLPARSFAQSPAPTLIDTHHHFYPPAYQKAFADWEDAHKQPRTKVQSEWTREKAVEAMDKNGIKTGILSLPSTAGLWFNAGNEAAANMVRICNDFAADMVRDYPGRFGLFAPLSMNHKLFSGPEVIPLAPLLAVGMKKVLKTRVVGSSCSMTLAPVAVK